jgi:hypothetical protein
MQAQHPTAPSGKQRQERSKSSQHEAYHSSQKKGPDPGHALEATSFPVGESDRSALYSGSRDPPHSGRISRDAGSVLGRGPKPKAVHRLLCVRYLTTASEMKSVRRHSRRLPESFVSTGAECTYAVTSTLESAALGASLFRVEVWPLLRTCLDDATSFGLINCAGRG